MTRTPVAGSLLFSRRRLLACTLMIVSMVTAAASGVRAFDWYSSPPGTVTRFNTGTYWYYKVDPTYTNAGFPVQMLHLGEQAWKVHELTSRGQYWNDNSVSSNRVVRVNSNNPGPSKLADATPGCVSTCTLTFYRYAYGYYQDYWYRGTGTPAASERDIAAIAAHEFGHWAGVGHACWQPEWWAGGCGGSEPAPASDPGGLPDTMGAYAGGIAQRTISQNDANGFLFVRATGGVSSNIYARHGFENTSGPSTWASWSPSSPATITQYCGVFSPQEGNCYLNYTANGASIFQDVNYYNTPAVSDFTWSIGFRPGGAFSGTMNLVLWTLWPTIGNVAVGCVMARSAGSMGWMTCTGYGGPPAPERYQMRLEAYATAPGTMDIDNAMWLD